MFNNTDIKLNRISKNHSELNLADGTIIVFSYSTPVAIKYPNSNNVIMSDNKISSTTARHITLSFNKELYRREYLDEDKFIKLCNKLTLT